MAGKCLIPDFVTDYLNPSLVLRSQHSCYAVFRRVFAHYDLAAEAYFRHLTLGGASGCISSSAPGTISATLRLLHLAVTHPLELHEVFQVIAELFNKNRESKYPLCSGGSCNNPCKSMGGNHPTTLLPTQPPSANCEAENL